MTGIRRSRRRPEARHEARNRRRGERARDHLERTRKREVARLRTREHERPRARWRPTPLRHARRAGLFALSLAAGIWLAAPLQERLAGWTRGELGRLESIAIQGGHQLSSEQIAVAAGVEPGTSLADVDTARVEQSLCAQPWIRSARVLRLPPRKLLVRVQERRAEAVLAVAGEDGDGERSWRLVDATGTPFAPATRADIGALPHLRGGGGCANGEADASLVTALELSGRLRDALRSGPKGLADTLELHLPEGDSPEGWVLRSRARSLEVVLGRAQLLDRLERLERIFIARIPGTRENVRIDLRFADQAVLRRRSASG